MGTSAVRKIDDGEVRVIELEILKEFAHFCESNGLRYFLAYGTLIGAVRHQGYIPWDNDVDVTMPRPDYEKFKTLWEASQHCKYYDLLDYQNVRTFPFLKLIDNRTVLKEHFLKTEGCGGLYIDIFPLDGMPDTAIEQKKLYRKANLLHKMYSLSNARFNTGKGWFSRIVKNMSYPIMQLIPQKYLCKKIDSIALQYAFDDSKYVGNIVWGFSNYEKEIHKKEYYCPIKMVFEDEMFNVPIGYDSCLKIGYGEYMKLPPEEDRVVHQFNAYWK